MHGYLLTWVEEEILQRRPYSCGGIQHSLFSEESLALLIESVERADYLVNTMDVTKHDFSTRREGEIRNVPGRAVLEALQKGHIWILLLHPQRLSSPYQDLLQQIYAEFVSRVPGFKPYLLNMSILISSPNVQVYYHCDVPGQMLWQLRGNKRIYIYPNKPPFLEQADLEKIVLGESNEFGLPYQQSFDEKAVVFDLTPGQMLHWPLNAPHRIVNGDCVNVSFATEHFTKPLRRKFFVNYANGVLRRQGGTQLSQKISGPSYWSKFAVAVAYKLTGAQKKRANKSKVEFMVDPAAPNGIRPITGYEFRPGSKLEEHTSPAK
jgi:hypothetical protein